MPIDNVEIGGCRESQFLAFSVRRLPLGSLECQLAHLLLQIQSLRINHNKNEFFFQTVLRLNPDIFNNSNLLLAEALRNRIKLRVALRSRRYDGRWPVVCVFVGYGALRSPKSLN